MKGSQFLMKLYKQLSLALLIVTSFFTAIPVFAEENSFSPEQAIAKPEAPAEENRAIDESVLCYDLYQKYSDLLQKYCFTAAEMAHRAQRYSKGPAEREALAQWIERLQKQALEIAAKISGESSFCTLQQVGAYLQQLDLILQEALKSRFKTLNIPSFEMKEQTRSQVTPLNLSSVQKVDESLQKLQASLHSLSEKISDYGVTTLNRIARKIDALNKKFYLSRICGTTATFGLSYLFLKWALKSPLETDPELKGIATDVSELKKVIDPNNQQAHTYINNINEKLVDANTKTPLIQRIPGYLKEISLIASSKIAADLAATYAGTIAAPFKTAWKDTQYYAHLAWNKAQGLELEDKNEYQVVDDITLDDPRLIGLEEQIKELLEAINNDDVKGILLYGPSRCGKTFLARALAGTLAQQSSQNPNGSKVVFKEIDHLHITYFGMLKHIIEDAQQQSGTVILFIDELHNLKLQTTAGDTKALNDFLIEMNNLHNNKNPNNKVIIIAATNRETLLDPALLAWGRFTKKIQFEKPTTLQRAEFFEKRITQLGILPAPEWISSFVYQTDEVSYGDLAAIIDEAVTTAKQTLSVPNQEHFQMAIDKNIHRFTNIRSENKQLDAVILAHITGMSVAHALLNPNAQLERVTVGKIIPKIEEENDFTLEKKRINPNDSKIAQFGGMVVYNPHGVKAVATKSDLEKQIKILLAGAIGQEILLGEASTEYRNDDQRKALLLAQKMMLNGAQFEDLSKQKQQDIRRQAEAFIEQAIKDVRELLEKNKKSMEFVITFLNMDTTIPGILIVAACNPQMRSELATLMQQSTEKPEKDIVSA